MIPDAPLTYDVRKVAEISDNSYSDRGSFVMNAQYDLGDGKMVLVGTHIKDDGSYSMTLYSVDLGTGELLVSKEMGENFSTSYIKVYDNLIWYWADPDTPTVTALNYQLEEVKTAKLPWTGTNYFVDDGSCWYIEQGELKHNLMDGSEPESVMIDGLPISYTYMSDIFTDGEHTYCRLAGDLSQGGSREMLAKLDEQSSVFGQDEASSMVLWDVTNGMLLSSGSKRIHAQNWMLVSADGGTYSYLASDLERLNVLRNNNGKVLFSAEDLDEEGNRILMLWLYDAVNGMLEGMTRLPLGENEGDIRNSVMTFPDGSLLLTVDEGDSEFSGSSACSMYRWYPDCEHTNGMKALSVAESDFKDLPTLAEKQNAAYWDPETYVPGPLSPELADLKERANALGEKLVENIQGMEGYALDNAGGLSTVIDDKMYVAIDVEENVNTVFPHEIAHCIDNHINDDLTYTKLFDSEWNKMNPDNFNYLYSYVENTPEELNAYTYVTSSGDISYECVLHR